MQTHMNKKAILSHPPWGKSNRQVELLAGKGKEKPENTLLYSSNSIDEYCVQIGKRTQTRVTDTHTP